MKAGRSLAVVMFAIALLAPAMAPAFKLQALGPRDDSLLGVANRQAQGFLLLFTSDVHERMTRRAYEMAGVKLPDDVMTGVRWNDNPPAVRVGALFGGCHGQDMKPMQEMDCFTSMFRVDRLAIETLSRREKSIAPLRSHFGDMQFLHAMAPRAGESAAETRDKVLRWSEFAYRIARGEIGPRVNVHGLDGAPRTLEPSTAKWVSGLFGAPEKKLWMVQDIFLPKSGNLRLIAFGTFLHLVQDSYSASHIRRAATRLQPNGCLSYDAVDAIVEFHTYAEQDTEKHALCDDAPDWLDTPRAGSPMGVMAELVRAYDAGKDWMYVKTILEEQVFRLASAPRTARAGRCFERRSEPQEPDGARPPPTRLDTACDEEKAP